jgi:hypothetical protein
MTKKVVVCQQWHFDPYINFFNIRFEIELLLPLVTQHGFYRHVKKATTRDGPKKDASLILGCFRGATGAPAILEQVDSVRRMGRHYQ